MQQEKSQRYKNRNGFCILWGGRKIFLLEPYSFFYRCFIFLHPFEFRILFRWAVYRIILGRKACIYCFDGFKQMFVANMCGGYFARMVLVFQFFVLFPSFSFISLGSLIVAIVISRYVEFVFVVVVVAAIAQNLFPVFHDLIFVSF